MAFRSSETAPRQSNRDKLTKRGIAGRIGLGVGAVLLAVTPFVLDQEAPPKAEAAKISAPARPRTGNVGTNIESPTADAAVAEAQAKSLFDYFAALQQQQLTDYLAAVEAGKEAEVAAQQASTQHQEAPTTNYSAPAVVTSGPTCTGTGVESIIRNAFAGTGEEDYFLVKAYNESNCIPTAVNEAESCSTDGLMHARGLLQLCGHDDLLSQACPAQVPEVAALDPYCNAQASRLLFNEVGLSPWGG